MLGRSHPDGGFWTASKIIELLQTEYSEKT